MKNKKERVNTNCHVQDIYLKLNKNFPNSHLPVLIYKPAFILPEQKKRAVTIIQEIFAKNGWSNSWKNGIYDFHHYHSITHECMAVSSGWAMVIIGGPGGRRIRLERGDLIILPAGVAHKCSRKGSAFQCVGAYPQGKDYDIILGKAANLEKALKNIKKLGLPQKDPLQGKHGFLKSYWVK